MIARGSVDKFCVMCGKLLTGNRTAFCSKKCFEKAKADGRYTYSYTRKKKNNVKSVEKKIKAESKPITICEPKPEPNPEKKPHLSFAEVCKRARDEGLSYGQCVARYNL